MLHQHLPRLIEGKTLVNSKEELVRELKKNKVDYAILVPDNTTVSEIGNLDDVAWVLSKMIQTYS